MSQGRTASVVMFWVMALAGGAVLVPCLVLPPWLEYRLLGQQRQLRAAQLAALERRAAQLERQIDHLRNDPAYLERLAREDLAIETPGVTAIEQDAPSGDDSARDWDVPVSVEPDPLQLAFPRLASAADLAAASFPDWVAVFLSAEARPWVLGLSCAMIASAILLLGDRRRRGRLSAASSTGRAA